eukprot:TRINITY_DN24205_c1_g1_i1.p1 TRINITY_DN24205_c1_g1~~TRINITY_DN24205_c1_g1_i1.p1  ORF type:complete len:503 (-),score=87.11 TRINITY_DN24205_c1_g1_i1:342-1850(-)
MPELSSVRSPLHQDGARTFRRAESSTIPEMMFESETPTAEEEGGGNPVIDGMEAPWANDLNFVIDLLALGVLCVFMGVASYYYNYIVGDLLEKWLSSTGDREYPHDPESIKLLGGAPIWIPLVWAGGTVVGIMKWVFGLDTYASFLQEIKEAHADPKQCAKVTVCCIASLFSGAALGPEAGLAAFGGGLGTFISDLLTRFGRTEGAHERCQLYVLAGIASAFGSIMPSPWVSVLICMECAFVKHDADGKQMLIFGRKTLFLLCYTASLTFVVRYAVEKIPVAPIPGSELDQLYENDMAFKAVLLGLIAAFATVVYAIIGAIFKQVFKRIGHCLERSLGRGARLVGLASLAGLITGVLGFLVPLSLTDGKAAMVPTAKHAQVPGDISDLNLFCIAIAKTASFAAAAAGGLVGGPFFPVLYIGQVVGLLCSRIPGLDMSPQLTMPVVMSAMPGALFPIPFTLVAFPVSFLKLGPLWCVPILIAVMTSYTLLVGTGFVKKLAGKR